MSGPHTGFGGGQASGEEIPEKRGASRGKKDSEESLFWGWLCVGHKYPTP